MSRDKLKLPITFTAPVVHGRGIGHTLGTPTVNQALPPELTLLPFGVYFSRVTVDGAVFHAVSNVGVKPTVTTDGVPLCETHIIDASLSLYGQSVKTELLCFRRHERHFDSTAALAEAITADTDAAREYFNLKK